jgi:spore germination cell wall hydrolase CwlJ-like protein|tara:strand:+ start:511 stop:1023 length:513 start_codon:yes stop_codon:yes gene_type:complete
MRHQSYLIIIFLILVCLVILITPAYASEELNDNEYTERKCLVEAIYFEGRSEELIAQLAIANVILERVKLPNYPDTVCKVVRQGRYYKGNPIRNKCAFSYWCDGKSERMYNYQAKEIAIKVAAMAMNGILVEITLEATHYHTRAVNPYWARHDKLMYLGSLGSHLFYIEN